MSTRVLQTVDLPEAVPPATPIMKGVLKAGMVLPLVGHPVLDRSFVIPLLMKWSSCYSKGEFYLGAVLNDIKYARLIRAQLQREPAKLDEND